MDKSEEQRMLGTLEAVCHHEAAHAVVAARLGRALGRVEVRELDENEWTGIFRSMSRPTESPIDEAERLLAGELAARRYAGLKMSIERTTGDERGDSDKVLQIAQRARSLDPSQWFKVVAGKTTRTVQREWRTIEAVARVLIERRRIEGEELLALINATGLRSKIAEPSVLKDDDTDSDRLNDASGTPRPDGLP